MFESYKLKKAKAKLELESVNKQLRDIEIQKEKERWEQMPDSLCVNVGSPWDADIWDVYRGY